MARSKSSKRSAPDSRGSSPTRFRRRRPSRRRQRSNSGPEAEQTTTSSQASPPAQRSAERASALFDPPSKLGRAPRPVEPPPRNPNVFSYTYTIWKS